MSALTSVEFWNILASISTILGFAVLIYATLVALGQLKEMTKSRHLEAMLRVYEMIGSEGARSERKYLFTQLSSTPENMSAEERSFVERVAANLHRVGMLVEAGLVPAESLFDSHSEVFIRTWNKLEPYIHYLRQVRGGFYVKHFEKMANAAKAYHSKVYPNDPVRDVWVEPLQGE